MIEHAGASWTMLALMQPAAAIVFALDGILIGAGDTRYLAGSMLLAGRGVYIPIALLALALGWGVTGVWTGTGPRRRAARDARLALRRRPLGDHRGGGGSCPGARRPSIALS